MDLLTPELGLFFWTLIAFLFVFTILGKFAWKPILGMLNDREKVISETLSMAERVKGEMAAMKADNEKLMAEAREERTQMLNDAKSIKDKMISEAKEVAKKEADRIIAEAQTQIQQQRMAALTEVKNEIGAIALQVAEKVLRKQLGSNEGQEAYMSMLTEDIKLN